MTDHDSLSLPLLSLPAPLPFSNLVNLVNPTHRQSTSRFNFKNRADKYSAFKWSYEHFTGIDYDASGDGKTGIFKIQGDGKRWAKAVGKEVSDNASGDSQDDRGMGWTGEDERRVNGWMLMLLFCSD